MKYLFNFMPMFIYFMTTNYPLKGHLELAPHKAYIYCYIIIIK